MGYTMMIDKNTVLVISGRPATKKNSSRIVRVGKFHKPLPSKAFVVYERKALDQLKVYDALHYTGSLQLTVRYYLPDRKWWPDLIGLLQATSDILQKAGIYDDDKYIVSYDGSCIAGLDKENPRCEIEIKELGPWLY
jgi:crossover junction endodeoxyribonuclease rusA superfamily|nr:MAG TPA: Endodeoxyribonuclease RusA [Caudoviricetes sp.]